MASLHGSSTEQWQWMPRPCDPMPAPHFFLASTVRHDGGSAKEGGASFAVHIHGNGRIPPAISTSPHSEGAGPKVSAKGPPRGVGGGGGGGWHKALVVGSDSLWRRPLASGP